MRGILLLSFVLISSICFGQYTTTKIKPKYEAYRDSLKNVKYDYTFPIWGQKAYSKGFDIPYPAGIMGNYVWLKQGVVINNLQLGLQGDNVDIPLTPVDLIEFGTNTNTSWAANIRPDLWVLPFINVYGIFGTGRSTTEVNIVSPVVLNSVVEQGIRTAGFGIMGAGGIGPVWFSIDANWTWNKPELLEKAVLVSAMGLRFGKTFTFQNNPDRNIAFWAGGLRIEMSSATSGAIKLSEAIPQDYWDNKDQLVEDYYSWYNSLDPNKPLDAKKIEQADNILTPIVERIDAIEGSSTVLYSMDKQVKEKWNGIVGGQYQLNKRWMLRSEVGIFGDRKSFLINLNYRFLI